MKTTQYLAAKFALIALSVSLNANAGGILVYDGLNNIQTTISAMEDVTQTIKQAEQYKTQIDQFKDQVKNSANAANYIWDKSDSTLDNILKTVDAVSPMLEGQGLDQYLSGYKSLGDYTEAQQQECYKNAACVATHQTEIMEAQGQRSTQQAQANQAAMRSVVAQQQQIRQDAQNLRRLQQTAQTANGRKAALDAGNMLASAQVDNLLKMREILNTQQQMQAAQAQAQTENDAALKGRNRDMLRGANGDRVIGNSAKF